MKSDKYGFFKSIKFRLWASFFGFIAVVLSFLYFSQIVLMPYFYEIIKIQESISTAMEIKTAWENKDFYSVKEAVDANAKEKQMGILINIPSNVTGRHPITYSSDATGSSATIDRRVSDEMVEELLKSESGMLFFPVEEDMRESTLLATYVGDANNIVGYIFIYNYLEPTGTTMQILTDIFVMISLSVFLFSFLASLLISSQITNPIIRISKSANKLITGEFNVQPQNHDFSEIKLLKENLNIASYEISRTEHLRKDLLANVSHDLRTPLTMIKAYAEMIRDLSGDNPEKRDKHLQVIIDETDRLSLLVSDILELSRLQSGVIEINRSVFNFSSLIKEIASRFSMLEETEVIVDAEEDVYISADEKQLSQAVYNLIINSINYSGVNSVTLSLKTAKGLAVFKVIDKGVGISAEKLPLIWDRYYKVSRSENYKRKNMGTGLGLSIVKSVFERHGFKYGVESEEGKGTTFWFECNVEKVVDEKA